MDLKGNGVSCLWICSERSVRWIGRSARSILGLIGLAGVLENNGTPPYSSLDSDLGVCGTFSSHCLSFLHNIGIAEPNGHRKLELAVGLQLDREGVLNW